jgi:hypothetical protein
MYICTVNTPVIGYDKFAWGATVQTITQAYSGLREHNSEDVSVGVREFTQPNVSGGISSRTFYFYENKLYRVFVSYDDVDTNTVKALIDRLSSIYGQFDDYDESSQASGNIIGKRISLYRYYNNNLRIVVNAVDYYNRYNIYEESRVGIVYFDPTIQKRIDDAKAKEKANKIQL